MENLTNTARLYCLLLILTVSSIRSNAQESVSLKIAAYNVEYSVKGSAQEIGEALKPYSFDVICFSEAPGGDWTRQVAQHLGLDHIVVGRYSTAGHVDKYKTIASKTPLYGNEEILMADTLHTATKAFTKVNGQEIAIYAVHFPFGWRDQAHIDETTHKISTFAARVAQDQSAGEVAVLAGDFNFRLPHDTLASPYHELFINLGLDVIWNPLRTVVSQLSTMVASSGTNRPGGSVIDHIFYDPRFMTAVDGGIIELERPLSDHKPVWATLKLD